MSRRFGSRRASQAYDGCRSLLWHNENSLPHVHRRWRAGDVLGLLLDLEKGLMNFSLNGELLPDWYECVFGLMRYSDES